MACRRGPASHEMTCFMHGKIRIVLRYSSKVLQVDDLSANLGYDHDNIVWKWLSGHGAWRGASEWVWYCHGPEVCQDEADLRMWYSWGSTDLRPSSVNLSFIYINYIYIYLFPYYKYYKIE